MKGLFVGIAEVFFMARMESGGKTRARIKSVKMSDLWLNGQKVKKGRKRSISRDRWVDEGVGCNG